MTRPWQHLVTLDEHAVILGLCLLGLFAVNFRAGTDPDFWWHLRTGQLIVESGAVPTKDVFSYTVAGQPWVAHEWLTELAIYASYTVGGYLASETVFALAIAATYFVLYRLLRSLGVDYAPALAVFALAAIVPLPAWALRPQLFTFLLFTIFLHMLFAYKRLGRARLWLLPVLMALWVNLHGGYIIGLMLIGIFAVGEWLNHLTHRPAAAVKPLVLAGLASAVAALANPNTYTALLYPFSYAGTANGSMRFISEWQSPDFHEFYFLPLVFAIVLFMLLGARGRFDFTAALIVLAFTLMALQSARFIVLFALATAPLLALRLQEHLPRPKVEVPSGPKAAPLPMILALVVVPPLLALVVALAPDAQLAPTPRTDKYPAGGVAYLKEHHPAGNLFNTYGWGGYLIYTLYPEYRPFIDGRADVYGDALVEEYHEVVAIGPHWREVLDKYHVATVLIEKDSALAVLLASQPDWQRVYEGEVEQIFVRKTDLAGRNG